MSMFVRWLFVSIIVVSLSGCIDLQRKLEYADLDEVAVAATGKQLWEAAFGDEEVRAVKDRLWRTSMKSLYCIKDNAEARYRAPAGLSDEQAMQRATNIKMLIERALLPTIEMRKSEAKRQAALGGCNTR